jgi:hypothetical protein
MSHKSLIADVTSALHHDPKVRSAVGDRVRVGFAPVELPEILIAEVPLQARGTSLVLTCRGKTLRQADRIGDAAISALKTHRSTINGLRFVTLQDRSGYDSASGAFRRVFQLKPEPAVRAAKAER